MKNSAFIVNPLTREGYYLNGKKEGWHKFDSLTVKDIDPYYRDPCRIKDDIELAYPTRMLLFTTIDWFKSLSSAILTKVHCVSSNSLCCLENALDDFNYGRSHYATTEDVEGFQVLVFYHEGYLFYTSGISVNDLVGFLDASDIVPVLDELYISEFRKTDNLENLVNRAKCDYEALFGVKQLATYTKTRSIQDDLFAKHLDTRDPTNPFDSLSILGKEFDVELDEARRKIHEALEAEIMEMLKASDFGRAVELTLKQGLVKPTIFEQDMLSFISRTSSNDMLSVTRLKERTPSDTDTFVYRGEKLRKIVDLDDVPAPSDELAESKNDDREEEEPRIKVKKPSSKATNMIAIALATAAHYSQSSYFNGGIPQYFDNSTRPYTGLSGKAPTYRGGKSKSSKGRVKGKGKRK